MNGQEITEPTVIFKKKNARKKRDAEDTNSGGVSSNGKQQANSTNSQRYGCPINFERVTEYICMHFGRTDDNKKDLVIDFEQAKDYCRARNAKPMYILNSDESLKIWKWLGKYLNKSHNMKKSYIGCCNLSGH